MTSTQRLQVDADGAARATGTQLAVDIVIDNYNYGRFVGDAIESALAQTHPKVKVIVVDDGSTDDSRVVIARYQPHVDVVWKDNGGQASALNAGFARCQGDAVIFLDSDDVLRPDAAARVSTAFAADPAAVKVQYRVEVIDESGRATGVVQPPAHVPLPTGDLREAELTLPFDLPWMGMSGNAFCTSALRRVMPIPEGAFRRCADWYLVHLTPLVGRVVSLEDVGAGYRVHDRNSYAPRDATLDLGHLHDSIVFAAATKNELERLAVELRLERRPGPILSVADVSNRLVLAKLAPELHPLPNDRVVPLALDGVRAASRRFDISAVMKLLFIGWFAVMAVAPRVVAGVIAERFLFPQRREALNRLLQHLHRWNRTRRPTR
jgi:glycosyltransferase involved in cell wall biosynthesis